MPFGIKFNSTPFVHTYIGRKAQRGIKEFLDKIGHENLRYAIENEKDLVTFFPPEAVEHYKTQVSIPKQYADAFPDEEVYLWIPPEYRVFWEAIEGGRDWAYRQLGVIRRIVVTS